MLIIKLVRLLTPSAVRSQVGDGNSDHYCWQRPEDMTTPRTAYRVDVNNPGSDLAGETAAAMASASIIFRRSDPAYSNELLRHAKQVCAALFLPLLVKSPSSILSLPPVGHSLAAPPADGQVGGFLEFFHPLLPVINVAVWGANMGPVLFLVGGGTPPSMADRAVQTRSSSTSAVTLRITSVGGRRICLLALFHPVKLPSAPLLIFKSQILAPNNNNNNMILLVLFFFVVVMTHLPFAAVPICRQVQGQVRQQHNGGPEVLQVIQWI